MQPPMRSEAGPDAGPEVHAPASADPARPGWPRSTVTTGEGPTRAVSTFEGPDAWARAERLAAYWRRLGDAPAVTHRRIQAGE